MDQPRAVPVVLARPHALTVAEVAISLDVDERVGLSSAEAARRLERFGANELQPHEREATWRMVAAAATQPFVILLALAGALAIGLGEVRDGVLVLLGLLPIVGADVLTEYRGERALEELRSAAAPQARVRRDGGLLEVAAAALVPGDVVQLQVGDVIPADLRVVESVGLLLDRSLLTGESLPESAVVAPDPQDAGVADRHAICLAGTSVVRGRGRGIVIATGAAAELGRIAGALGPRERRRSPLQRELDRLVRILLAVAIGLIAITMGLGVVRGEAPGTTVLAGISAAIAAIPEEPPVLLAVILGLGAYRLLRRGVLVRRLSAQETLGAVDLILTDKTGTLTENRLTLGSVCTPDGPVDAADRLATLTREALRAEEDAWGLTAGARPGSFTRALTARAAALGVDAGLDPAQLIDAEGAGEGRAWSRTRAHREGSIEELVLGAPEAVLEMVEASAPPRSGSLGPWHELVGRLADEGSRLLLLARRVNQEPWQVRAVLDFRDQLRDGVPDALRRAAAAGIQTVIVTGDHPLTTRTIAALAGLSGGDVVTGRQVEGWDAAELERRLPSLHVVARAVPEQKLRLVDAARSSGRTVAVTGDGVNDAPALQRADVAVAMGSGTGVAREAADLVLGDDSFVTLMGGLFEGRRIVDNVQKGLVFLVSTHVALLGFILIATVWGFAQPLLPVQILWLELFIDSATAVAFEREPPEPDLEHRPPRPRGQPLLTRGLLARIGAAGGFSAVAALSIMVAYGRDVDHGRWLAYTALVCAQAVRAYANRSLSTPVTRLGRNGFLLVACVAAVVVQLLIPSIPALAAAFHASPLDAGELSLVAAVALAPAVLAELIRRVRHVSWVA